MIYGCLYMPWTKAMNKENLFLRYYWILLIDQVLRVDFMNHESALKATVLSIFAGHKCSQTVPKLGTPRDRTTQHFSLHFIDFHNHLFLINKQHKSHLTSFSSRLDSHNSPLKSPPSHHFLTHGPRRTPSTADRDMVGCLGFDRRDVLLSLKSLFQSGMHEVHDRRMVRHEKSRIRLCHLGKRVCVFIRAVLYWFLDISNAILDRV
jgi:hypothetical protein